MSAITGAVQSYVNFCERTHALPPVPYRLDLLIGMGAITASAVAAVVINSGNPITEEVAIEKDGKILLNPAWKQQFTRAMSVFGGILFGGAVVAATSQLALRYWFAGK